MEKIDLSERELQHKAEMYCAKGERCASQVRHKIAEWGGDEAQAERIIARLEEDKYLSIERFCQAFAHDKLMYQGWGRLKIQMALRQLNLPEVRIQEALKNLDLDDYRRILKRVAKGKKGTPEQVKRFLLQRGFTFEEIKEVVNNE